MTHSKLEKKVLFISYLFPPVGGGGVQRSSKFVKYLPSFGWKPLVLTVKEPYDFYSDKTLLADIGDDTVVFRTISFEPMKWVRKIILKKSKKNFQLQGEKQNIRPKSIKPGFLVKLKTLILIPDNEIFWLPFAVLKGLRIIRKESPCVIYATALPFTDHLIALILSKLSGIPVVQDFRDFWVDRANFPKNKFRLMIDSKLEKMVLRNASHVITSTRLITKKLREKAPAQHYKVITNGYDEDDFKSAIIPEHSSTEFRITYAGIFNKEQNPGKIFYALRKIIDERAEVKNSIKLRFVGQLDNPGDFENVNLFNKLKLNSFADIVQYKTHPEAIAEMNQATVLLLLVGEYPDNEGIYTGKIFEYLRSGRPVLAVVPPNGIAAELIRTTNSGIVVSNSDVDGIAEGISQLFDLFVQGKLSEKFTSEHIEKYSRRHLTGELSVVFNSLIE